jgi:hypothetical protein
MNMNDFDWDSLQQYGFTEKATGDLKDACWKGYTAIGMKKKGGRKVPNCVKIDSKHSEGDIATAEMTPNYLPKEPGAGDEKNPQMGEQKIRMPRMEEIAKASENNGQLAMAAAPNYSEDRFYSDEPNARMIITQLRVAREKIDTMLGVLYPDDNLEPWAATKIANAGVALASVADYLRYGGET